MLRIARRALRSSLVPLLDVPGLVLGLVLALALVHGVRAAGAGIAPTQDPEPCRLLGKLVDGDGEPVAGASLSLKGRPFSSKVGPPAEPWSYPEFVTSSDGGWFEFEFVAPEKQALVLLVTPQEHAQATWFFWELAPGETDLGDVLLRDVASLSGTIVDANGDLLVDGWSVDVQEQVGFGTGREGIRRSSRVDPESGTWTVTDVPAGPVTVSAQGPERAHLERRLLTLVAGENPAQVLVHADSEVRPGVRVRFSGLAFQTSGLADGSVVAIDSEGRRTPLVPEDSRRMRWEAPELQEGVYTIEVQDPRFERAHVENVAPGEWVPIELEGRAGLSLTVVDAAGVPAQGLTGFGTLRTARTTANESGLTVLPLRCPGCFQVAGLVAGDWALDLSLPDGTTRRVLVEDLGEGEVRTLRVDLGASASISGRVVDAAGNPVPGVEVHRSQGSHIGHDSEHVEAVTMGMVELADGTYKHLQLGYRDEEAVTDGEGRFRFDGLMPGPHAVRAVVGPYVQAHAVVEATVEVEAAGLEGGTPDVELRLPPHGRARVHVRVPGNVDPTHLRLAVRPAEHDTLVFRQAALLGWDGPMLDAEGRCVLEGVPAGTVVVHVAQRVQDGIGQNVSAVASLPAEVPAGGTAELELDLRERFPSDGTVTVLLDGEVAEELSLDLHREADAQDASAYPARVQPTVDLQAFRVVGAIPGRYRVDVQSREGWTWTAEERLEVPSNTEFEHTVELTCVRRTLRVVDTDGAPLAGFEFALKSPRNFRPGPALTTDAEGRCALHLPPCELNLARPVERGQEPEERTIVRFAFEPGEGDLEVVWPGDGE